MKTKKAFIRHLNVLYVFILVAVLGIAVFSCKKTNPDNRIQQAYDLRMNGNADSALVLLDVVLAEDSTNALALYEIARTMHHIGLGNPRQLFGGLGDMQDLIGKAVENDPDNVIYKFYQGYLSYLGAYIAFMQQQPDASEKVKDVVEVYESVLDQKPDYNEATLYLVEILSVPKNMGGDSLKAQEYANKLVEMDAVFGAKATELLLPDSVNRVEFWHNVLEANQGNAEVLEQLGKAYLYKDSVNMGIKYLEEAMKADPEKDILLMDIARFYLMSSRGDSLKTELFLPDAEIMVNRYLETEPIKPLKAYVYSIMAWVKDGLGKTEEVEIMRDMATEIDPNVSKAFGLPPLVLFASPEEISHYYGYFSRPF